MPAGAAWLWWASGGAAGAVASGALAFSLRYCWWRRNRPGVPVLAYRHVLDQAMDGSDRLRVSTDQFQAHLEWLERKGYQTVPISQALNPTGPSRRVALTFDCGFADFYYFAWPRLRQRDMTATVFLVTGYLDRGGSAGGPKLPMLTREQVLELAGQGVEFGGCSHTHKDLTSLDDRGLRREVTGCQKTLNDMLGRPSRAFAYPYGRFNEKALAAVERAGFTSAFTLRPGKLTAASPPLAAPRITLTKDDHSLDLRLKLAKGRSRWKA